MACLLPAGPGKIVLWFLVMDLQDLQLFLKNNLKQPHRARNGGQERGLGLCGGGQKPLSSQREGWLRNQALLFIC